MFKRSIVVLVPVLMLLALPAVAGATIVVNRGMFGVSLGATPTQVRQKLGAPSSIHRSGGRTDWFYFGRNLLLVFRAGKTPVLQGLYTQNPKQRTANGLGVGSSEQDVMSLVPGVQCSATPGAPGTDCIFLSERGGHFYGTDFGIGTDGRASAVLIMVH